MSTTQALLFRLQQLDLELDRLNAEQQAVTNSLQGNATVRKMRADYANAQQQKQSGLQAQKEAEWTLEDLERRIQEQELRLYNGSVTNARELQALQQEVQRLHAQRSRQEDVLLQVIDAAEALEEHVRQTLALLKQKEDAWQQESTSLQARRERLEEQKQDLQRKRSEIARDLSDDILVRYDGMRRSKQGRAVSKIEQNSCQWCRVILTPSELQRVRISSEIQTCTNCGRILYYER